MNVQENQGERTYFFHEFKENKNRCLQQRFWHQLNWWTKTQNIYDAVQR